MNEANINAFIEQARRAANGLQYVASQIFYTAALNGVPRYRDPKSLVPHGFRVYSQNEEDGILAEIIRRIGATNRRFVEFGVGDGLENNTLYWLMQGWTGLWIDGNAENITAIRDRCASLIDREQLGVRQAFIDADNIELLLAEAGTPEEPDILSIDIDGNDYWVWRAISAYRPRAVVIEYNAGMGPSADWKQTYDAYWVWQGTRNFGASLKALELLGKEKGYCLVGCSIKGMNAFFVREDLVGNHFQRPFTAEQHYEPPRYHLWFSTGHRKDPAEFASFGA
jgi:hypothetical protein